MKSSPHILAVLWDMDGVLVDSGESHYRTWKKIFTEQHIPFDRGQFGATFGMNNLSLLQTIAGEQLDAQAARRLSDNKERIWRESIRGQIVLMPGVRRWLERFQQLGLRQAVASSAPAENIAAVVDELGIRGFFDALAAGGNMAGKPAPDVFLHAAALLSVPPAACLVLEDSIAGIEAARRAGMRCIAVTTTHPRAALTAAERVLDSLEELDDAMLPPPAA